MRKKPSKINSNRKFKYTKIGAENVERYAEDREDQNLVDLALEKKPLNFADEFHMRMLGRIKEMLDPYREELAHALMKNEVDEEVEEIDESGPPEHKISPKHPLNDRAIANLRKRSDTYHAKREAAKEKRFAKYRKDDEEHTIRPGKWTKLGNSTNEDFNLDEKKDNEYGKEYSKMYNERNKFFKKKAKGMTKPIMKEGEEQLDELSKKVLGKYMKKASKEAVSLAGDITKGGKKDKGTLNKFKNRVTGVHRAKSAVDEEQQLDERDWSFKTEKARRNKNNTRVGMEQKPYTQRDRDNEKKIPMAREEVEDC